MSDKNLFDLLQNGGIVSPSSKSFPEIQRVRKSGKMYFKMENGMLSSSYINIKEVIKFPSNIIRLAYEVILVLAGYFVANEAEDFFQNQILLIPNNTAMPIGSAIQAICDIQAVIVDKLGPIPSGHILENQTSIPIEGKNVNILVEVSATGGELDRAFMFVANNRANLVRSICCYNLLIGRSFLSSEVRDINLCTPKERLFYEYRSH